MYVEMKNIYKKYGDFVASDHVSFGVEKGKLVALLGPSGSGKTTLLRMIAGLESPNSGDIYIDGKRMNDVPASKRGIGFVFQNYALFPNMTVEKNILYGVNNRARDGQQRQEMLDYVTYIMDTFRIQHLRKKYPRQISGGEKQRTALARAIVTKPDLLLLDEPFSALDIKTKEIVYQEFLELKHAVQIPIILISHDPREGDLFADHRLYLADGHISTAI